MSLQWTVVAGILYAEIFAVLILLLPWVRPSLWSKFFRSRIVTAFQHNAQVVFYAGTVVLFILFADAIREVNKYGNVDSAFETTMRHSADADAVVHMRLFRAQRNFYISGFALLLFLVIKRLTGLLQRGAQMEAASEAAMRQAESATKTARTLMEAGGEGEVKDLMRQNEELGKELKNAHEDRDTMKKQAEGLREEYTRVCELLEKAEAKEGSKKDD